MTEGGAETRAERRGVVKAERRGEMKAERRAAHRRGEVPILLEDRRRGPPLPQEALLIRRLPRKNNALLISSNKNS